MTGLGRSSVLCTNASRHPLYKASFAVEFGDLHRRTAVVVPGPKVGSAFDEQCQCRWSRISLGREMGGGSAAESAGVYIRAVRDQPRHRALVRLMSERLQQCAADARSAIDRQAPGQERFGDIVRRPAVTLKVASAAAR
jgi:hypothetical protein